MTRKHKRTAARGTPDHVIRGVGRREFLRAFGAGATVGAAAAGTGPLGLNARADTESNDEKRKARYRETEHVKTYYRVNRYPG